MPPAGPDRRVARARAAAAAGNVDACYQLAVWRLVGDLLPRDVRSARGWLRKARQGGHVEAARLEIALTGNGSGNTPDFAAARRMLGDLAKQDANAAAELVLLDAMAVSPTGDPAALPQAEIVSRAPTVVRYRALLTPAECAHVASVARDLLEPSIVVDPVTGRDVVHPIRTSHAAVIGPARETLVVQAILRRIAALTSTQVRQGEPLSVLHYAPGQEYRPHVDALPGAANQRIKTVIVYLNEGYAGGGTHFFSSRVTVTGRGGDAIVFDALDADGRPDAMTIHAGLPVTAGAKWIATRWIRAGSFDPWAGST